MIKIFLPFGNFTATSLLRCFNLKGAYIPSLTRLVLKRCDSSEMRIFK